jgi:hypothetical protein
MIWGKPVPDWRDGSMQRNLSLLISQSKQKAEVPSRDSAFMKVV